MKQHMITEGEAHELAMEYGKQEARRTAPRNIQEFLKAYSTAFNEFMGEVDTFNKSLNN